MFTSPNWVTTGSGSGEGGGGITSAEVTAIVDAKLKPVSNKVTTLETSVTSLSSEVTALTTTVNEHISNKNNPHGVTPAQIGAATADHTHTLDDLGAAAKDHNHDEAYAALDHTHTASSIGAATATHTHTYSDVTGVAAADHNHNNTYAAIDHTHEISDIDTLSDELTKMTNHIKNYDNPHKTSDDNLVKVLKFDFTDKTVAQPFTVSRASKEWALDENDKFVEYDNNTLAYAWDKTDNRYGAQLFNSRTRLNSYYKTPIFEHAESASKNINSATTDATSQTGDVVSRIHLRDTTNVVVDEVFDNEYSSVVLLRNTDSVSIATGTNATYTLSIRLKTSTANDPDLKAVFWCTLGDAGTKTQIGEVSLSSEWQTSVLTFTVTNENETDETLTSGFYITSTDDTVNDIFIDVDWFQIEQTAYATPLIMGTEGTQITVLRTAPLYTGADANLITTTKQISVYSESKKYYYGGRPWQIKTTSNSVFRYHGSLDMKNRYKARVENNVIVEPESLVDTHYQVLSTEIPLGAVVREVSLFDFVNNEFYSAIAGVVSDTKTTIVNVPWVDNEKQLILSSRGESVVYLCGYLYHLSIYTTLLDNEKLIELTQ